MSSLLHYRSETKRAMWGGGKKDKRKPIQEVTASLSAAWAGNLQRLRNLQHGKPQSLYMAGRAAERNKDYYRKTFYMAGPWGTCNISYLCKACMHLFPHSCGKIDWPSPGLSKNLSKQEWTESKWSAVSMLRLFPWRRILLLKRTMGAPDTKLQLLTPVNQQLETKSLGGRKLYSSFPVAALHWRPHTADGWVKMGFKGIWCVG